MTDPKARKQVSFLEEDVVKVSGQRYTLLCVVNPDRIEGMAKGSGVCAIKLRGSFDTKEQAQYQAKKVHEMDDSVDTYCVDMYSWLLLPPDNDKIGDVVYGETYLNNLFENVERANKVSQAAFQKRVEAVREEGLDKHLLPEERVKKADMTPEDFKIGDRMPNVHIPPAVGERLPQV